MDPFRLFLPIRKHLLSCLVHQHVDGKRLEIPLKLWHLVHRKLGFAHSQHATGRRLGPVLAQGSNHKRQVGAPQVAPHIPDEVPHVRRVFVLGSENVIETLEPHKACQFQRSSLQLREQRDIVLLYVPNLGQQVAIGDAVVFLDVFEGRQRGGLVVLFVVLLDAFPGLLQFLLQHDLG